MSDHLGGEGILTPKDRVDLAAGRLRVLQLMLDGRWHNPDEVRSAAGGPGTPASEGLRRLRELRGEYRVEKIRVEGSRVWLYRVAARKGGSEETEAGVAQPRKPDPNGSAQGTLF